MAFKDDLKKYVDIALVKSKDAFGKGKKAVSKFGDDSAIRIEKLQYEQKLRKELSTLGKLTFAALSQEKKKSVSLQDELIAASIRTIEELNAEIARRADLLKKDDAPEQPDTTEQPPEENSEKKDENSSEKSE